MGFDVYGARARSKTGEYFRNSVWWWRPLAEYVLENVNVPENDADCWQTNSGYEVSARSAEAIAERLDELLASGAVAQAEWQYAADLTALPDEACTFCKRSGVRDDDVLKGKCNACAGSGTVRPWAANYGFSEENVREFAAFCRESGGFSIR